MQKTKHVTLTLFTTLILLVVMARSISATIGIDGSASNSFTSAAGTVSSVVLTTTSVNDIVFFVVGGTRGGSVAQTSGITDTGDSNSAALSWHLMEHATAAGIADLQDVYWANAVNTLTNDRISITTGALNGGEVAFAVNGANVVTPFDPNSGFPYNANCGSSCSGLIQVSGVSTSNAKDMLIASFIDNTGCGCLGANTPFVNIDNWAGSGPGGVSAETENELVSSTQSSISASVTGDSADPFIGFVEAIQQAQIGPSMSSAVSSNAVADQGQTETLTWALSGGTAPYTYNFLVSNTNTGNVIFATRITNSITTNSVSFTLPSEANDIGTVTLSANAVDNAGLASAVITNTISVSKTFSLISETSSNSAPLQLQTEVLTITTSGGSSPYSYNFLVTNTQTSNIIFSAVQTNALSTNSIEFTLPFEANDVGTITFAANAVDSASVPENVLGSNTISVTKLLQTNFVETGLPTNAYWNVTFGGSLLSNGTGIVSWTAGANVPSTVIGSGVDANPCVPTNNYVYCVGGVTIIGSAVNIVFYGQLTPTGVSSWADTANVPSTIVGSGTDFESCVPTNNYIYCNGGKITVGASNEVYYGQLLPTGIGSWTATSNIPYSIVANGIFQQSCVPTNNYVYCVGGFNTISIASNMVYYAQLLPTGETGWATTTNVPIGIVGSSIAHGACVPYNNFIYCIGGQNSLGAASTTNVAFYGQLLPTGVANWAATGNVPSSIVGSSVDGQSCVTEYGYVYCIGGFTSGTSTTNNEVFFGQLTPTGVSSWIAAANVPSTSVGKGTANNACVPTNGYIYCSAGKIGITVANAVFYGQLAFSNEILLGSASGSTAFVINSQVIGGLTFYPTPSTGTLLSGNTLSVIFATLAASSSSPIISNSTIDVGQISVANVLITNGLNGYTSNWLWSAPGTATGLTSGNTVPFSISNTVPANVQLIFNAQLSNTITLKETNTATFTNTLVSTNSILGTWTLSANVIDNNGLGANTVNTLTNTIIVDSQPTATISPSGSSITTGQTETFTATVSGGTGPFQVELFNATSGAQQGSNVIVQSPGGSNTIAMVTGATGSFSYNLLVADTGTSSAFNFNSLSTTVTVTGSSSGGGGGGGGGVPYLSTILNDSIGSGLTSDRPIFTAYILNVSNKQVVSTITYNQAQLPVIVKYRNYQQVNFTFVCTFNVGTQTYAYQNDVYGIGLNVQCGKNYTANPSSYSVQYYLSGQLASTTTSTSTTSTTSVNTTSTISKNATSTTSSSSISTSSTPTTIITIISLPSTNRSVQGVSTAVNVSATGAAQINFTNTNTIITLYSNSIKSTKVNVSITNVTGLQNLPKNINQALLVAMTLNLQSKSPTIANMTVGYPCYLPSTSVAPYQDLNNTWQKITPFTVNPGACTVSFQVRGNAIVAVFATQSNLTSGPPYQNLIQIIGEIVLGVVAAGIAYAILNYWSKHKQIATNKN